MYIYNNLLHVNLYKVLSGLVLMQHGRDHHMQKKSCGAKIFPRESNGCRKCGTPVPPEDKQKYPGEYLVIKILIFLNLVGSIFCPCKAIHRNFIFQFEVRF